MLRDKHYIVIPAHFDSRRLPGKVLLQETGKPLIQHTWEQAIRVKYKHPDFNFDVVIATDNDEIEQRCTNFGAKVVRTGKCDNGTERVADAVSHLPFPPERFCTVTNLQVDYPDFPIDVIPSLVSAIHQGQGKILIATIAYPNEDKHEFLDKDNVKVVTTAGSVALYFSRSPIPYDCEKSLIHVGIYTFHFQLLQQYNQIRQQKNPLIAESEGLEQNKWLFGGLPVFVMGYPQKISAINTIEDYQKFVKEYKTLISVE